MKRNDLKALVEYKVDEIFLVYQEEENIESGDISPEDAFKLDELEDQLTDLIIKSMEHNRG